MPIGARVKRRADGETFRVVGSYGGQLVLGPDIHGPSITVSSLELRTLFDVDAEPEPAASPQTTVFGRDDAEQTGWERLAAAHVADLAERRSAPTPPTPEEAFAAAAAAATPRRRARRGA